MAIVPTATFFGRFTKRAPSMEPPGIKSEFCMISSVEGWNIPFNPTLGEHTNIAHNGCIRGIAAVDYRDADANPALLRGWVDDAVVIVIGGAT